MGYSRKKIQKQGLKTYLFEKSPGIFVTLSGFLPLRGWGFWFERIQGGGGGERKIQDKNLFFSDNFEWSSKDLWKMIWLISKLIKATRNKRSNLVTVYLTNFNKYSQKLKKNVKWALFFILFWFWLVFYPYFDTIWSIFWSTRVCGGFLVDGQKKIC